MGKSSFAGLDPQALTEIATRAIAEMQRNDPERFERLSAEVEAGAGGLIALSIDTAGMVTITIAGHALATVPRALVERRSARRLD